MINNLKEKGALKGFKRTPQRLPILEHFDGNTSHPSAEDIYRVVARKNRSMSTATVYNTLKTLVEAGALREPTIDPDRTRYDPDTSAHHHLICLECRKLVDIHDTVPVEIPGSEAKLRAKLLGAFTILPASVDDHVEAARLKNLCISRGADVSGIDCLIAASAIAGGHELFTADKDFESIRRHTKLRLFENQGVA